MTKVFISSTSQDLKPYRESAIELCKRFGFTPIAMEYFTAMSHGATEGSRKKLDEADLYIGIFAHRYGYIEKGYDRSVTEIEFDYAGERSLDRLCFLVDPTYKWPAEFIDTENTEKLRAFKARIEKSLIRAQFTDVKSFTDKLYQALDEWREARGLLNRCSTSAILAKEEDSIPGKTRRFRGRTALIEQTQFALNNDDRVLLQGFGGMGKTTLAAQCAVEHLPVLWIKAGADSADAVFEALARPFNMQKEIASQQGEEKIALMRQILAGSGANLILIDDVWNGATLKTLLDAIPGKMKVLVTARERYPLDTILQVGELPENEALEVLSAYAGRGVKTDPDAAVLCKFLGYHAFALEIAGSMMKVDNLTAKELRAKIDAAPHQMKMPLDFAKEDRESIKQLLDASVDALDGETRRVFLAIGAMFAPQATSEMLSLYTEKDVENALNTLTERGLAERVEATGESIACYRIHDLSYAYAKAQTIPDHRYRGLDTCLNYTERYNEPNLLNFAALRPELDNFLGAAAFAMQTERWSEAEQFAWNLYSRSGNFRFLAYRGFYNRAITLLEQAVLAAEKQGNKQNQGAHLGNLGLAYANLGEYRRAIEYHEQGLQISRDIGDKQGEESCLGNLGLAYANLGEYRRAIEYHEQALQIARDIGDKRAEGSILGNLGNAYGYSGEYSQAIQYHQQALQIARDIGDKQNQGNQLGNLGNAYQDLGDYRKAIDYHEQVLRIAREMGDKLNEGRSLGNLGSAYRNLGEYPKAIGYFQHALQIARDIGDKRNQGNWLGNLGIAYTVLGEYPKAIDYYQQALQISREIGDKRGEGSDLGNLGLAYANSGEYRKAIEYHQQALQIARDIGDRHGEGNRLNNLGLAYADLGEYQKAIEYYQQAMQIARDIGDRRGESSRLGNLGSAYRNLGEYRKAIEYHQQALQISRAIGDKYGEGSHMGNLGSAYFSSGEYSQAIDYYQNALQIARDIGDKRNQGNWLSGLGLAYRNLDEYPKAIDCYQQALNISREIGNRISEASTLNNLGVLHETQGNYDLAIQFYQQARAIYAAIGAQHVVATFDRNIADARAKQASTNPGS